LYFRPCPLEFDLIPQLFRFAAAAPATSAQLKLN
jgi:hypothetical protein